MTRNSMQGPGADLLSGIRAMSTEHVRAAKLHRVLDALITASESYVALSRVQGPSLRDEAAHRVRAAIATARAVMEESPHEALPELPSPPLGTDEEAPVILPRESSSSLHETVYSRPDFQLAWDKEIGHQRPGVKDCALRSGDPYRRPSRFSPARARRA